MDIFSVLSLIGGLALFLYGMHVMGDGLSKLSGGKMEKILETLTSNPLKAVGLGALVTAVIQSSSATTVMVVGFVNSGIMKLSQAVGIIMGANIGTTITSWILSLSGIESDSFFIQLFKPTSFSPVLAIIGVAFLLFAKSPRKKDIGTIFLGFAVLMFGMESMSSAVKPLADVPEFTGILTTFENPLLGMVAGALLTAIIQSSSASVGILQALCVTGAVSYAVAVPIILGQNIGTCVTALLSAIGAKKNAKRAAMVHLYFNLIGTAVFLVVFYGAQLFVTFGFMDQAANAAGIAVVHSVFNVFATLVLLPFSGLLEKLACLTIREEAEEAPRTGMELLDVRFLEQPSIAMEQSRQAAKKMSDLSRNTLLIAMSLLQTYDKEKEEQVLQFEDSVDKCEDALGTYLVKLGEKDLNQKDSRDLSLILHCIGDFERISDHGVNIMESAREMYEKGMKFSDKAARELAVISRAVEDIVNISYDVFKNEDKEQAKAVEPLEEVIDELNHELKDRHIRRLRQGKCTIEQGFVLSDITTSLERIADHCSNIAVCILQIGENSFDTHGYLNYVKKEKNREFLEQTEAVRQKYLLP
ncbi:MAG TPA: Na/Pi cotransporter family protein [Candidatus Blautia pullicola]|uniref:Na/Pi cotransporter family protein n=1 Tax=Candidatus Blautia pullicola TaxID=2838498 RepID=A0A9D2FPX1_9FIRM|nr:Na/Pi cotransporter family protein [Candidatus Blautia pullicola]